MNLTAVTPFNVNGALRNNTVKANNVSFGMAQLPDKDITVYRDEFVTGGSFEDRMNRLKNSKDEVEQARLIFAYDPYNHNSGLIYDAIRRPDKASLLFETAPKGTKRKIAQVYLNSIQGGSNGMSYSDPIKNEQRLNVLFDNANEETKDVVYSKQMLDCLIEHPCNRNLIKKVIDGMETKQAFELFLNNSKKLLEMAEYKDNLSYEHPSPEDEGYCTTTGIIRSKAYEFATNNPDVSVDDSIKLLKDYAVDIDGHNRFADALRYFDPTRYTGF